jgi:hypothetical protein
MIGSLFILNEKGSVLFEKHYRRVSSRACCEDFWKMIERRAGEQVCHSMCNVTACAFASPPLQLIPALCCSYRPSSKKALSRTSPAQNHLSVTSLPQPSFCHLTSNHPKQVRSRVSPRHIPSGGHGARHFSTACHRVSTQALCDPSRVTPHPSTYSQFARDHVS